MEEGTERKWHEIESEVDNIHRMAEKERKRERRRHRVVEKVRDKYMEEGKDKNYK